VIRGRVQVGGNPGRVGLRRKARKADVGGAARQIDRIVHDGRGRHASEVQELVRAEAKNLDNLRIEP